MWETRQLQRLRPIDVVYPISDIGRCRKCGKYVSCTRRTSQRKDFESILTVKMETRHPVEDYFGIVSFRQSVIIAELWRPEVARPGNFVSHFCFFGKTTPCVKIFTIMFWNCITWRHRSTLFCSNFVKCCRREIGEIVRYSPHQNKNKISAASQTVAMRGSCPKSVRDSPQQCAPDFIQIGSLSVLLGGLYSRMREHRFVPRRVGYFQDWLFSSL